jgi:biotin carboxyl carrier protein
MPGQRSRGRRRKEGGRLKAEGERKNMQVEVKVPQLSESVSEATLVAWKKKAGEAVKRDENLIDIETDKVVLELPAPADGVLSKILKNDGDSVTSGDVIAIRPRQLPLPRPQRHPPLRQP